MTDCCTADYRLNGCWTRAKSNRRSVLLFSCSSCINLLLQEEGPGCQDVCVSTGVGQVFRPPSRMILSSLGNDGRVSFRQEQDASFSSTLDSRGGV